MLSTSKINFQTVSYALVFVAALFLSLRNIYGEDIGFHLQAGRWMFENFSFPDNDTFTYTASENRYIDLNWLYQLLMYGIYSLSGEIGLILLNSFFISGTIFFLFKRIKTHSSPLLPWILLLAVLAVSPSLEIRPHSVSWLLLSVGLYLLEEYSNGNKKIIKWLPLVMLLWVNMHSLFILGLVVLGCYSVSIYWKNKKLDKHFLLYGGISILICFLNPYGWHGLLFPFEQIAALKSGNVFNQNIRELQSPFSITQYDFSTLFTQWHFFDLFVAAAVILFIVRFKNFRLHEWLISAIFFYFAYAATKNIGYFIFAITPFIVNKLSAEKIESKKKNKHAEKIPILTKYSKQIFICFIFISALLLLSIRSNAFYIHYRTSYRFGWGWSNANLPVQATEFLLKNNLKGKMLNQPDYGGYLEFFTNQKTSIDGRLDVMEEKNFNEQVNANSDAEKQNLLQKYNPEIILFSYFSTPDWIVFLQKKSDWRLAYADENAALYLRNDFAASVPVMNEQTLLSSLRNFSDEQIDFMIKEKKNTALFYSLFQTHYYPEGENNLIAFCFYYNWIGAAKQISANGFQKATSGYPEMYQNLGSIFFQLKDKTRSLYCYEKYLETNRNEQVAERVRFLKSL